MNNTTLEKMQWLYEQGFKPSSYFDPEEIHGRHFVDKSYAEDELPNLIILKQLKPWYDESYLWELLGHPTIFWDSNLTMLEILLHKVIQAVNKGHLKAEVESKHDT